MEFVKKCGEFGKILMPMRLDAEVVVPTLDLLPGSMTYTGDLVARSDPLLELGSVTLRHLRLSELHQGRPDTIATLGNAAARVFAELVGLPQQKLSPDPYGIVRIVDVSGREVRWYPLAHPAAPEAYQAAHADWVLKASA